MNRHVVGTFLLVGLLVTSGCIGFLTGDSALTFESNEVSVNGEAQSETGYDQARRTSSKVTKSFSAAGQTRNVTVVNHVAEYKRTVGVPGLAEQELARFTVFASPEVEVLDRTFNPLADLSNRDLAMQLQEKYETVSDVQAESDRTVTVLGQETTVTRFSAKATVEGGQQIDVYFHLTKFKHGDDFVVAVAIYPRELDGEQSKVDTLIAGIEHSAGED